MYFNAIGKDKEENITLKNKGPGKKYYILNIQKVYEKGIHDLN